MLVLSADNIKGLAVVISAPQMVKKTDEALPPAVILLSLKAAINREGETKASKLEDVRPFNEAEASPKNLVFTLAIREGFDSFPMLKTSVLYDKVQFNFLFIIYG